MRDSTGLNACKQSMVLDISLEIGDDDVTGTLQIAVPCEEATAADGGFHATENERRFSVDGAHSKRSGRKSSACLRKALETE